MTLLILMNVGMRYESRSVKKCSQNLELHLMYLEQAVELGDLQHLNDFFAGIVEVD